MTEPPVEGGADEPADDKARELPRRRVLMSAGARTVEVEGPDELDALAYLATALWAAAGNPQEPKLWAGGMGFSADIAAPPEYEPVPDDRPAEPYGR